MTTTVDPGLLYVGNPVTRSYLLFFGAIKFTVSFSHIKCRPFGQRTRVKQVCSFKYPADEKTPTAISNSLNSRSVHFVSPISQIWFKKNCSTHKTENFTFKVYNIYYYMLHYDWWKNVPRKRIVYAQEKDSLFLCAYDVTNVILKINHCKFKKININIFVLRKIEINNIAKFHRPLNFIELEMLRSLP